MTGEHTESVAVPEKSELGGSSSGKIFAMGKPSSSDKECNNDAYTESSGSGDNVERSRMDSTGKPSSPKSYQKISPHYLRASTGSCHDFCKYGIKHGFEEEEKRLWRKKTMLASSGKQHCVVNVSSPQKKKSTVARSMSFPVSLLLQHEASSDAVSSLYPPEIIKEEIMPPREKFEGSSKQDPSSGRRMLKKGKRTTNVSEKQSPVRRQSCSFNFVESGQNAQNSDKKMNSSSEKFSLLMHSQLVKARSSSSVACLPPAKSDKKMNSSSERFPPLMHSQLVKARSSSSVACLPPAKARLLPSIQFKEAGGICKEAIKSSKIKSNLPYSAQAFGGANGRNKRRDDGKMTEACTMLSSSLSASTTNERSNKREDINTRKNMASFGSSPKKTLASPRSLLSSQPSSSRITATKSKKSGSLKLVSPRKEQKRMLKKEIGKTSEENVPEKTLYVVEVETKDQHSESTEDTCIAPPLPPLSNLSPVSSLPKGMCLSSREEVGEGGREAVVYEEEGHREEVKLEAEEEEEEENTHEDEVKQEEGDEGEMETEEEEEEEEDEYVYESDEGDGFNNGNETVNYNDPRAVEENHCKSLKKGYIVSDSRDSVQLKLKFRRGKILDIQSENMAPRRLRFRQRRIVEENNGSKNEVSRKNFRRRYGIKGNINNVNDEKIVLRHQDLQGKKDAQGLLLNNVIEETASKLVESRKSKVKALVGAFETVISLQDSKPSAQLVA